jgi:hypothetical protein
MLHGFFHGHDSPNIFLFVGTIDSTAQNQLQKSTKLGHIASFTFKKRGTNNFSSGSALNNLDNMSNFLNSKSYMYSPFIKGAAP